MAKKAAPKKPARNKAVARPKATLVTAETPAPSGPIAATLMDADETRVVAEVEITEVVPILEHDGEQFEPVRPESWGHWIYRQLTK